MGGNGENFECNNCPIFEPGAKSKLYLVRVHTAQSQDTGSLRARDRAPFRSRKGAGGGDLRRARTCVIAPRLALTLNAAPEAVPSVRWPARSEHGTEPVFDCQLRVAG